MTFDLDGPARRLRARHELASCAWTPTAPAAAARCSPSHYDGKELNSPNDVVVKSDGAIYFTDPTYGRMPGFGIEREQDLDFQGVYRIAARRRRPAGASPATSPSPTGCASRSTSRCSTSTTPTARTSASSTSRRTGRSRTGASSPRASGPASLEVGDLVDGMKLDERGNIWVTGPGGVCVFDPQGEHIGTVEVPEPVGQPQLGRAGLELAVHPRHDVGVPHAVQGRPATDSPT